MPSYIGYSRKQPLLSLAQIPGLSRLYEVCEEFDVEITAFGSIVRRLAQNLVRHPESELPDLFDLAPFLSDIDLRHSGKPEQTDEIRDAILSCVPYSECFRWEIFSDAELAPFREDEEHLPVIPVNKLTLSVRGETGIADEFDAIRDLGKGYIRFLSNPFYLRSKLRQQYRDCELLHAVFYLQVLMETTEYPDVRPIFWEWERLFSPESESFTRVALAESAYLRSRLRYRLDALRAVCRSEKAWNFYVKESGLSEFLESYGGEWGLHRFPEARVTVTSCRLGGDLYRLPPNEENRYVGADSESAKSRWEKVTRSQSLLGFSSGEQPRLIESQRIVASSPSIRFSEGVANCSKGDEFIHLEFPVSETEGRQFGNTPPSNLGVLAVFSAGNASYIVALPGACGLHKFDRAAGGFTHSMQVRANCGRLLEVFPKLTRPLLGPSDYRIQLFIAAEL